MGGDIDFMVQGLTGAVDEASREHIKRVNVRSKFFEDKRLL